MYKLVVLCAFLAAAVAEPSAVFYSAPFTTYSTVVSPATTTISKQASSVIHPSPAFYTAPAFHYLKKRSAQFLYSAPTTFISGARFAAPYYANHAILPATHATYAAPALAYSGAHFIKKRSAPLFPTTYIAPTSYAAAPLFGQTYAAHTTPYFSTPIVSSPLYSTHYIKKRSPQFFYGTPTTVVSTSSASFATPYVHSAAIVPATTHVTYASPLPYTAAHFIKKRSAPLLSAATYIAPTTYAATPFFGQTYAAHATPLISTPYLSSPYYATHYIKK